MASQVWPHISPTVSDILLDIRRFAGSSVMEKRFYILVDKTIFSSAFVTQCVHVVYWGRSRKNLANS